MDDTRKLGQFIPLHYHYNMLADNARMSSFRAAIHHVVKQGDVVLELGSGTGVLSFFAAQNARKVYSVELNLDLVEESRRILKLNDGGERVEVVHADALLYLPPEPVDVVICEMLHVGLLREKQLEVILSFKKRYQRCFSDCPMPALIPEAVIQSVQPVWHDFKFEGYCAPVIMFQDPYSPNPRTTEMGAPAVYHQLVYEDSFGLSCRCDKTLHIATEGKVNALRFITKNLLTIIPETESSVDWHSQYLILPLEHEISVSPGQEMKISFEYLAGAPLTELHPVVNY